MDIHVYRSSSAHCLIHPLRRRKRTSATNSDGHGLRFRLNRRWLLRRDGVGHDGSDRLRRGQDRGHVAGDRLYGDGRGDRRRRGQGLGGRLCGGSGHRGYCGHVGGLTRLKGHIRDRGLDDGFGRREDDGRNADDRCRRFASSRIMVRSTRLVGNAGAGPNCTGAGAEWRWCCACSRSCDDRGGPCACCNYRSGAQRTFAGIIARRCGTGIRIQRRYDGAVLCASEDVIENLR